MQEFKRTYINFHPNQTISKDQKNQTSLLKKHAIQEIGSFNSQFMVTVHHRMTSHDLFSLTSLKFFF